MRLKREDYSVYINCGQVHDDYQPASEYLYENIYRIRKKSVYHRKYHILNVISDIAQKNRIHVDYYNREKILRIFALIDKVSSKVDTDRKRMIGINFILKQLFDMFLQTHILLSYIIYIIYVPRFFSLLSVI